MKEAGPPLEVGYEVWIDRDASLPCSALPGHEHLPEQGLALKDLTLFVMPVPELVAMVKDRVL